MPIGAGDAAAGGGGDASAPMSNMMGGKKRSGSRKGKGKGTAARKGTGSRSTGSRSTGSRSTGTPRASPRRATSRRRRGTPSTARLLAGSRLVRPLSPEALLQTLKRTPARPLDDNIVDLRAVRRGRLAFALYKKAIQHARAHNMVVARDWLGLKDDGTKIVKVSKATLQSHVPTLIREYLNVQTNMGLQVVQAIGAKAMKWWEGKMKAVGDELGFRSGLSAGGLSATAAMARHEAEVVQALRLRLPELEFLEMAAADKNLYGAFVPFSQEAYESTNTAKPGKPLSLFTDARPYVEVAKGKYMLLLGKEFRDALQREAAQLSRRSGKRGVGPVRVVQYALDRFTLQENKRAGLFKRRTWQEVGEDKRLREVRSRTLKPYYDEEDDEDEDDLGGGGGDDDEDEVEDEDEDGVGAGSDDDDDDALLDDFSISAADREMVKVQALTNFLGPLGRIVFYAVLGGDVTLAQYVYDVNTMYWLHAMYFDNLPLRNFEMQRRYGGAIGSTTAVTESGRRFDRFDPLFDATSLAKFKQAAVGEDEDDDEDEETEETAASEEETKATLKDALVTEMAAREAQITASAAASKGKSVVLSGVLVDNAKLAGALPELQTKITEVLKEVTSTEGSQYLLRPVDLNKGVETKAKTDNRFVAGLKYFISIVGQGVASLGATFLGAVGLAKVTGFMTALPTLLASITPTAVSTALSGPLTALGAWAGSLVGPSALALFGFVASGVLAIGGLLLAVKVARELLSRKPKDVEGEAPEEIAVSTYKGHLDDAESMRQQFAMLGIKYVIPLGQTDGRFQPLSSQEQEAIPGLELKPGDAQKAAEVMNSLIDVKVLVPYYRNMTVVEDTATTAATISAGGRGLRRCRSHEPVFAGASDAYIHELLNAGSVSLHARGGAYGGGGGGGGGGRSFSHHLGGSGRRLLGHRGYH